MKELLNLFDFKQKINYKTEILSGLTVTLALVPEAVAFSLIAGLSPLTGLYAAFTIGLITSIFGGRPGMISGATGAVAVVIVALAKSYGVEYVFAAVVLAGVIQMLAGSPSSCTTWRWPYWQGWLLRPWSLPGKTPCAFVPASSPNAMPPWARGCTCAT